MEPPRHPLSAGEVIYQRQTLTLAVLLLSGALLVSILANFYQLWRSGAVHYITVGTGKRLSRPGEIPSQALRDVATSFVLLLGNGSPAALKENWQDAERYMTNEARAAFGNVKATQLPLIKSGNITLTTEGLAVTDVRMERQGRSALYRVALTGTQTVRYGSISMGAVEQTFEVTLLPGNKDNVHGLWIADFHWPPLRVPSGDISLR